jgi:CubicO group peptidase (beta-lactamase class C family)
LGWALERAGDAPLDRLAHALVFEPLGLCRTGFLSTERGPPARWPIAASEAQADGRHLRGEVHDLKARRLGGVAGHAGLFSTAPEIQRIADALIDAYHGRASVFSPPVVRRFFDARPLGHTPLALGWARPGFFEGSETAGLLDPETTVGHHGFTGTSLWIDLPRELSVVLLTNRVYHGRDPAPIAELRRSVHALLGRALRPSVTLPR